MKTTNANNSTLKSSLPVQRQASGKKGLLARIEMLEAVVNVNDNQKQGIESTLSRLQSIRAQTTDAGLFAWTFDNPYPAGEIPVVSATAESNEAGVRFDIKVLNITNIKVDIEVTKTKITLNAVGLITLSSVIKTGKTWLHLQAFK